jgi:O-acetylserine/cysteine efflux transporter
MGNRRSSSTPSGPSSRRRCFRAHTAYYGLIHRYEVNLLQSLMLMTPLANIALGVLITHDRFDARMAVGSAVTLLGVLAIALRRDHVTALLAAIARRAA